MQLKLSHIFKSAM